MLNDDIFDSFASLCFVFLDDQLCHGYVMRKKKKPEILSQDLIQEWVLLSASHDLSRSKLLKQSGSLVNHC